MIQVSGLRFPYTHDENFGSRVQSVLVGGKPLNPRHQYRIAANSVLADGGHNYEAFSRGVGRREIEAQYEVIEGAFGNASGSSHRSWAASGRPLSQGSRSEYLKEVDSMIFELESQRSLAAIDKAIREAAERHKFGVLSVINLKEKMKDKGIDFPRECSVYEVCNPHQAKRALEANGAVSTALPCRISVYGTEGGYKIATLLPTAMMTVFATPVIDEVAREVEADMVAIVKESA